MKFRDTLKFSFHSLWNNKMMTVLVTIVLLILSLLVTTIISFSIDMMGVSNKMVAENNRGFDLTYRKDGGGSGPGALSEAEYNLALKTFAENKQHFDSMIMAPSFKENRLELGRYGGGYAIGFVSLDSDIMTGKKGTINAGRLWNTDDKDKDYIWVTKDYAIGNNVAVGDTLNVRVVSESTRNKVDEIAYTIMGIIDVGSSGYDRTYEMYMGVENIEKLHLSVSEITLKGSPLVSTSVTDLMKFQKVIKEQNTFDYRTNPTGLDVHSYAVSDAQFNIIMSVAVIVGALFFSLIIILLSIGCISNAIQITVEQNRKFFGVMKAVGLRNKTVKKIVRWQAVIMILVAVIIASCITVGILAGIKPMIFKAFAKEGFDAPFGLPFYVPFIVFFMQVGLVIIFTNKSLNKISKMDVISVISEVN